MAQPFFHRWLSFDFAGYFSTALPKNIRHRKPHLVRMVNLNRKRNAYHSYGGNSKAYPKALEKKKTDCARINIYLSIKAFAKLASAFFMSDNYPYQLFRQ